MAKIAPGGPGNMLPVLLVGGALLFMVTRSRASTGTVKTRPAASSTNGPASYETPTTVAERLARVVTGLTKGIRTAPPKTDAYGQDTRDYLRMAEGAGLQTVNPNPFAGSIFGATMAEAVPGASFSPPDAGIFNPIGQTDSLIYVPVYEPWPTGNGE